MVAARSGPSRRGRWFRRLRPAQVGLLGAGLALLFVALRLTVAADGDIGRFVVAGDTFVARTPAPGDPDPPHVFPGHGYDGQFFWRLAVDPSEWDVGAHEGVAFDGDYRVPRIGYPLLAHLAAGGQAGAVVWTLVGVNVAAVGAIAYAGALIAARGGSPPVWGLALAAAPGLVLALGRDLAECVTVACLVGGLAALQRGRPLVAAGAWALAVLTREQALLTVGAYAAWRLYAIGRARVSDRAAAGAGRPGTTGPAPTIGPAGPTRDATPPTAAAATLGVAARPGPGPADLPWLAPIVVFLAWQGVLWQSTGQLPLAAAGGTNLVPPFSDLLPGLVAWARGDLGRIHAVAPLQLAGVVALLVAAARAARSVPAADRFPVVALGVATVAGTCLAASIWRDPSDMRHLVDVSVMSWVVLLIARTEPPRWAGAVTGLVWVATVAARVVAI